MFISDPKSIKNLLNWLSSLVIALPIVLLSRSFTKLLIGLFSHDGIGVFFLFNIETEVGGIVIIFPAVS